MRPRGRIPSFAPDTVLLSRQRIEDLRPRYIAISSARYGCGISIRCPRESSPDHSRRFATAINPEGKHRIDLWFITPDDGYEANQEVDQHLLCAHMGNTSDGNLTIFAAHEPDHVIRHGDHFCGMVVESVVFDTVKADG